MGARACIYSCVSIVRFCASCRLKLRRRFAPLGFITRAGNTSKRLLPSEEILSLIILVVPFPKLIITTTAPTPMITPSIVKNARKKLRLICLNARIKAFKIISNPLNHLLSAHLKSAIPYLHILPYQVRALP